MGETYPDSLKTDIPKILMALYNADILEEEVVTQWATHVSKKVRFSFFVSPPLSPDASLF